MLVQAMCGRLLALVILLILPAGAWQRIVRTAKGSSVDFPQAHPLAYFTRYPVLRDESGDFCYLCSPEKRLAEAKKVAVKAELHFIGTFHGHRVYDVFDHFVGEGDVDWKSILVKTGQDRYREIYHVEPTQIDARCDPSVIVKAGSDRVLGTRYEVGGNQRAYGDDYFWFDAAGASWIDLDPIYRAAESVLPEGRRLWRGGDANTVRTFSTGIFRFWTLAACGNSLFGAWNM